MSEKTGTDDKTLSQRDLIAGFHEHAHHAPRHGREHAPFVQQGEVESVVTIEYMAQAVKMVLTSRGRDPRDYVYVSFGGAGGLHASFVADSLSIPKVIVPAHAGVARKPPRR